MTPRAITEGIKGCSRPGRGSTSCSAPSDRDLEERNRLEREQRIAELSAHYAQWVAMNGKEPE